MTMHSKFTFKNISLIIFMLLTGCLWVTGQECGTSVPDDYVYTPGEDKSDSLLAANDKIHSVPELIKPNINLSITAYVIGDTLLQTTIEEAIDSMNYFFKPSGISFALCHLEYIDDPGLSVIINGANEQLITNSYSIENTLNVYIVDSLVTDNKEVCGYAYLPVAGEKNDFIFISKRCMIPKNLTHQTGHSFGLLHTHETEFGSEFTDGTNCATTGDLICDTKASPDLSSLINTNCEYTALLLDPTGNYYWPSVSNLMSSSKYKCLCMFTAEQIQRIIETYYLYKSYLR
jgi:hypothetical protein